VLAVVQQRLATAAEVLDELAVAGRVRHRAVLRDALKEAADGAESMAEVDVVPLLRLAGLPRPRRQVRSGARRHDLEVDLPDGRVLVVEVDGPQHESPQARWADAERDAALAAEGKLLLRIPAYAVRHEPGRVLTQVRAIHDAARARAARR
jgi:very-short-patch-repair endonuclease